MPSHYEYTPVAHALTAPTPTSPNAAAVIDAAIAYAEPSPVGSEHVLWALFNVPGYSPRILDFIARKTAEVYQAAAVTSCDNNSRQWFRDRVMATLMEKGLSAGGGGGGGGGDVPVTPAMQRILSVTQQLGKGTVQDGDTVFENGLIATEFIVAAMLLDGRSVAADILSRCSRGLVNSWNLLEAIKVDPASLHPPQGNISYEVRAVNGGLGAMEAWEPASVLPDIGDGAWCAGPLPYANWLIPGRLMIGETPHGDSYHAPRAGTMQSDLKQLVSSHIDTFVCLRGEWGTMDTFMAGYYPKHLLAAGLNCNCLFFPIEDYRITHEADVVAMVLELRRRMRQGERLYIHCHSGHGRTGMVCIPLVASLFGLSAKAAIEFVQKAHDIGRNGGGDSGWLLPETDLQRDLVVNINKIVCQEDIGHGGLSSSSSRSRK
jgi:protein-tyrosine phosphatase